MSDTNVTPSSPEIESATLATHLSPGGRPGTISSGERLCRPVPASYQPHERRKHALAIRPDGVPALTLIRRVQADRLALENARAAAILGGAA